MPVGVPYVEYQFPDNPEPEWINMYNALYRERMLFLCQEIEDTIANELIGLMLYLNGDDPSRALFLYINSPGGSVTCGIGIYDIMRYLNSGITTICMGTAASMASFILAGGTYGRRIALPNSRIMIHQPEGGSDGQATEILSESSEVTRIRRQVGLIYANRTQQSIERIAQDLDRDQFMSATEARAYGLIDYVACAQGPSYPIGYGLLDLGFGTEPPIDSGIPVDNSWLTEFLRENAIQTYSFDTSLAGATPSRWLKATHPVIFAEDATEMVEFGADPPALPAITWQMEVGKQKKGRSGGPLDDATIKSLGLKVPSKPMRGDQSIGTKGDVALDGLIPETPGTKERARKISNAVSGLLPLLTVDDVATSSRTPRAPLLRATVVEDLVEQFNDLTVPSGEPVDGLDVMDLALLAEYTLEPPLSGPEPSIAAIAKNLDATDESLANIDEEPVSCIGLLTETELDESDPVINAYIADKLAQTVALAKAEVRAEEMDELAEMEISEESLKEPEALPDPD